MKRLNRNDHTLVAFNAYQSVSTAYDLVQMLDLDDDVAAHLHALLKESSAVLRNEWTKSTAKGL